MARKHPLFSLLVMAICGVAGMLVARACSCPPQPTVLESFNNAAQVIIARAVSIEPVDPSDPRQNQPADPYEEGDDGVARVGGGLRKMEVVKVFKGDLKVGQKLSFPLYARRDCWWSFGPSEIGQEYLFYMNPDSLDNGIWYVDTCMRSGRLDDVTDDLRYLNNLAKVRGKTRISGTIRFVEDEYVNAAGITLRFTSSKKHYEVTTDSHGVYEIYDLPEGTYVVETKLPKGWKIDENAIYYSPVTYASDDDASNQRISIKVTAKKHTALDLYLKIDNAIRGRLVDSRGNPLAGAEIQAIDPAAPDAFSLNYATTEADGSYILSSLQPGNYVIVVNQGGGISASMPFETLFYPNVSERAKATVLYMEPGEIVNGIDLTVPELVETVTVTGTFSFANGAPVADGYINFKSDPSSSGINGDVNGRSDANGKFTLKLLKGLRGKLSGAAGYYPGKIIDCPALKRAVNEAGPSGNPTTQIEITADADMDSVLLKFPFSDCSAPAP